MNLCIDKTTAVFRYEIKGNKSTIAMPAGAVVLSVLPRQGRLDLYALVDTTAKPTDRHFVAVKTGELQSDAGDVIAMKANSKAQQMGLRAAL